LGPSCGNGQKKQKTTRGERRKLDYPNALGKGRVDQNPQAQRGYRGGGNQKDGLPGHQLVDQITPKLHRRGLGTFQGGKTIDKHQGRAEEISTKGLRKRTKERGSSYRAHRKLKTKGREWSRQFTKAFGRRGGFPLKW